MATAETKRPRKELKVKKNFLVLVFLLPMILLGCQVADRAEVEGIKAGWDVIGPRYTEYLKADPKFSGSPDILADRLKTADDMGKAIERLLTRVKGK
jgi:hypothetical protein